MKSYFDFGVQANLSISTCFLRLLEHMLLNTLLLASFLWHEMHFEEEKIDTFSSIQLQRAPVKNVQAAAKFTIIDVNCFSPLIRKALKSLFTFFGSQFSETSMTSRDIVHHSRNQSYHLKNP